MKCREFTSFHRNISRTATSIGYGLERAGVKQSIGSSESTCLDCCLARRGLYDSLKAVVMILDIPDAA